MTFTRINSENKKFITKLLYRDSFTNCAKNMSSRYINNSGNKFVEIVQIMFSEDLNIIT